MALAHASLPPSSSSSPSPLSRNHSSDFTRKCRKHASPYAYFNRRFSISVSVFRVLGKADFTFNRVILNSAISSNVSPRTTTATTTTSTTTVEIPVTCYQLIGVPDRAEKDEIVKSVMQLKSAEVEEGYTMDAVSSRQDLLMDIRDKLLFEPEYAGNLREKIPPKSSLRIPWAWLPGALCLLQEAGEDKLVLDIGREALQHAPTKPYVHDILLSMALAECAIAKAGFEKNKVSHGFEALARAQCLLRSKISLEKMPLLYEIEESLEELAPVCTLELLGMPHSPENAERRRGAIAALRELLRQGLDVETSCRVQDWSCFLSQSLNRLMATEIVDLIPWDNLALVRKNKKSLESQNQRVVIDFNCFYLALIAHVAVGFSSKQKEMINKAKAICECLMASEGIDLKFEEGFCSFLLGQGTEAQAVEKLHQLQLNSNPASRSLFPGKETKDGSGVKPSLETWLRDAVLSVFPDTRDCSPSMVKFFAGEKRSPVSRSKTSTQTSPAINHRPLSDIAMRRMDIGESHPNINSVQHLGSAIKQLAPTDLQSSLLLGKNGNESDVIEPPILLKRDLGAHYNRGWEFWLANIDIVGKTTLMAVLGCILFFTLKLSVTNLKRTMTSSNWKPRMTNSSLVYRTDPSHNCNIGYSSITGSSFSSKMDKLWAIVKRKFQKQSYPAKLKSSELAADLSSRMEIVSRKPMPAEEAEALIKHWQTIKAEALGPSHEVHSLTEVLDGLMLSQWQALADAAKARPCHWRFVLLRLSVLQADVLSDVYGVEMAEIEALLEEAAELVDECQQNNPNYYSTYKIHYILRRQDDGSWKFCEGDVQAVS
ncbi:Plastid division protein CDP1 chloroplastic [Euphorbia peplus]|nr:Plastid division protein CDP1 chloroplastic [Euphorbia peplus]